MALPTRTFLSRPAAAVAVALALAGCAGTIPEMAAPTARNEQAIAVTREQNGRFIAFVGPKAQHDPPFLGVAGTNIDALRSWLDTGTGEIVNQLYVEDSYAGPERGWNAAQDGSGQNLRFISIGHDEISCQGGCSYAEEFAAALPEPLLRASLGGLAVTFTAKSGAQMTIRVPGEEIANQLAAVDSARKGLALQPTPPSAGALPPAAQASPPGAEMPGDLPPGALPPASPAGPPS